MVSYSGSGKSIDDPIVVDDVPSHLAAIEAEYAYIANRYGIRGLDWELQQQTLMMPEGSDGRVVDALIIKLSTGEAFTVFFEITKYWDMW